MCFPKNHYNEIRKTYVTIQEFKCYSRGLMKNILLYRRNSTLSLQKANGEGASLIVLHFSQKAHLYPTKILSISLMVICPLV